MVDSLTIHDILRAGNLDEDQARAMTAAIQKAEADIVLDFKTATSNLATKFDMANFATKADIANFATKADLANFVTRTELKADLAELKAELVRWMFMFWAGHTAVILTVVFAAIKFLR